MQAAARQWPAAMAAAAGLSVLSLGASGLPAAQAATGSTLARSPLAHSCLIGTWRDTGGTTFTMWDGHRIAILGGAGNYDHIFANGIDHDFWGRNAKPYYGTYRGHRLTEIIRGSNTLTIRGSARSHTLQLTEDGWSAGSSISYRYQGRTYSGSLGQSGKFTMNFRCTARKLTWLFKRRADHETRVGRTP